jgi:putative transcriptional regulator
MRDELFNDLVESIREAGAIRRGRQVPSRVFVADGPNIKRIRTSYDLSQDQFAAMLGISLGTLRNWEQGRRTPEGAARVLLQVAASHPEAILDVVRPTPPKRVASASTRRRVRSAKS